MGYISSIKDIPILLTTNYSVTSWSCLKCPIKTLRPFILALCNNVNIYNILLHTKWINKNKTKQEKINKQKANEKGDSVLVYIYLFFSPQRTKTNPK